MWRLPALVYAAGILIEIVNAMADGSYWREEQRADSMPVYTDAPYMMDEG